MERSSCGNRLRRQECFRPPSQHQQRPKHLSVAAAAAAMIVQQRDCSLLVNQGSDLAARIEHNFAKHWFERAAHPAIDGNFEALFGPIQQTLWQKLAARLLEN